ncbi:MAG: ABC transporter substrate-binding protein [Anaerolineales bacterium]|nr:ABC transporter substrate-binding protein [Anaerolineales bacterium]
MKTVFSRLGWFLIILTLLLTGCAPQAPTQVAPQPTAIPPTEAPQPTAIPPTEAPPAAPKQLIIALNFDVVDLDPARSFSDTYLIGGKAMYDQLTEVDPKVPGKVNPLLAEKWEVSSDGLTYTFTLRKGVKFESGNELTAKDVAFSLTRLKNLKGNPSFLMDGVDKVEAVDNYTVMFTLAAPDASFLSRTAAIYMGIVDSEVAKTKGCTDAADADTTDTCGGYLNDNSLGSGPYILEKWERNAEIRLRANENYWKGKPNFSEVLLKLIGDPTTQAQMLKQGDIDIAMNIDADTVASLEQQQDLVIYSGLGPSMIYLAFNTRPEISEVTSNQKFRQAVEYAIDYDGLTNAVLNGYAVHPPSILPIGFLGGESVQPIQRDLAKAKQLLTEAGYPDGVTLDVHYAVTAQFGLDFGIVWQKIQSDLAEVGITINLLPEELSVFLQGYRGGQYPFILGWQTPDYPDSHANASCFAISDGVFAKRMAYVNKTNDELVKKSIATTDPKEREAIYGQILQNVNEDAVFIGLAQAKEIIVYSSKIEGYRYDPVSKIVVFELNKK